MNTVKPFSRRAKFILQRSIRRTWSLHIHTRNRGTQNLLPQRSVILQPSGKQKFKTVYFDTALSKGIYHLNYSVNFTHYAFNGEYVGYENKPTQINEPILHKSGHKRHSIILPH